MPFSFEETEIKDLWRIRPHIYRDERGIYRKNYEKDIFTEYGIECGFSETSEIYSAKGALRGLHYQTRESQAKLIHVIRGKIFDVALDLRRDSDTFGRYHTEFLTDKEPKELFIPEGFAHGFISLTDETVFSYQCSGKYIPEACGGIRWDDPVLDIPWPLGEYGIEHVIATEKDRSWPDLEEYIRMTSRGEEEHEDISHRS